MSPNRTPPNRKHDRLLKFAWTFESLWSANIDDCTDAVYSISDVAAGLQDLSIDKETETSNLGNSQTLVDETELEDFPAAEHQPLRTENSSFYSQDTHPAEFVNKTWHGNSRTGGIAPAEGKNVGDEIPALKGMENMTSAPRELKAEPFPGSKKTSDLFKPERVY